MNAAPRKVVDYFLQIGRARISLGRMNDQVSLAIDVKIACAPVFYAIRFDCLFYGGRQLIISPACILQGSAYRQLLQPGNSIK